MISGSGFGVAEGQLFDRKSLRLVQGGKADFSELAKDCVAFANGAGGQIVLGVEDDADGPAPGQRIPPDLVDRVRKRVGELTVNVQAEPEIRTVGEDEVLVLHVPRSMGVASTSDGRHYLCVGDQSRPVVGDDVLRLATERPQATQRERITLGLLRPDGGAARRRSPNDGSRRC